MSRSSAGPALRLLHIGGDWARDPVQRCRIAMIEHGGSAVAHSFAGAAGISALQRLIDRRIERASVIVPHLDSRPGPGRMQALAQALVGYDLILTYGWQAINAVLAHTMFAPRLGLPPLLHHEDGLEPDERERPVRGRNAFRMLALARTPALVVPSDNMARIAIASWKQPAAKVHRIWPGIATAARPPKPRRDLLPRVIKQPGELFLGTIAGHQSADSLLRLLAVLPLLPEPWQLVIVGEPDSREAILADAVRLGVGHRVHMPVAVAEPAGALGLFDLFVHGAGDERFPLLAVQAMAAGVPVVGSGSGEITRVLGETGERFIVPPGDGEALAQVLVALAEDSGLRAAAATQNLARARAEFDRRVMARRYAELFAQLLGKPSFP